MGQTSFQVSLSFNKTSYKHSLKHNKFGRILFKTLCPVQVLVNICHGFAVSYLVKKTPIRMYHPTQKILKLQRMQGKPHSPQRPRVTPLEVYNANLHEAGLAVQDMMPSKYSTRYRNYFTWNCFLSFQILKTHWEIKSADFYRAFNGQTWWYCTYIPFFYYSYSVMTSNIYCPCIICGRKGDLQTH